MRGILLAGGTGYIKGAHRCVCFSEAPIGKLSHLLAENDHRKFKYQPYGVLVDKKWLYRRGGRPVIYCADADYDSLPEASEDEEDLLDRAWGLTPVSRLSCQAIVEGDDLVVEIPRYTINYAKEGK